MNELYAIDPKAPEDLKDIKAMLEQFGLSHGKFIANYPEDWTRMFNEHVQHLQGLDRSRFVRLLDLHKDALIHVNLDFRRAKTWIENASQAKAARKGISRILATDPNLLGIETLKQFLWETDSENTSRGAHIPMSTDAYCKAVAPLFQHSTEVHLIDPFFQLRRPTGDIHIGREGVLRAFIIEAENSNRCEILKIHFNRLKDKNTNSPIPLAKQEAQILDDLNKIHDQIKPTRISITFDIEDELFHGRYIFSIKGGLHFDHGFEPLRDKTNHVHWLSKAELEPLLNRYC